MLSRRRSVVWVRKGSIERSSELKLGDNGSGNLERDSRVGGCTSLSSIFGVLSGRECRNDVRR